MSGDDPTASDDREVRLDRQPSGLADADPLEPFGWYAEMRDTEPVRFDPERGVWDVFGYEDVKRVLRDHDAFSSSFDEDVRPAGAVGGEAEATPLSETMITSDPPRHERLRSVVDRHFRAEAIRSYQPQVEALAAERVDGLDAGEVDLVSAFSYPFPVDVIAALLGVPADDRETFKRWSDAIVERPAATPGDATASAERRRAAVEEMDDYFGDLLAARAADPRDDLVSAVAAARADDPGLSEAEAVAFCMLLLVAGNVTTTHLLTSAVWCLAASDLTDDVRSGSLDMEATIAETLRYRSPVQALVRVASEDVDVGGETIAAGDVVVPWIGSANRDERAFDDPERFDPTRRPNAHLAFGHGIHYCLGAPLARLEARVGLRALLDRFDRVDADLDGLERASSALYGLRGLPVELS